MAGEGSSGAFAGTKSSVRVVDVARRLFTDWQRETLQYAFIVSGVIHLLVAISPWLGELAISFPNVELAAGIGVVHLALFFFGGSQALRVALLLLPGFVEIVALGSLSGWQPEFSLLSLFVAVYGGVLLPRRVAWLPVLGVAAFLLASTSLGPMTHLVSIGALDDPASWRRVAFTFLLATSLTAFTFERSLRLLLEARESTASALRDARAEHQRLEAIRRTIAFAERRLDSVDEHEAVLRVELRSYIERCLAEVRAAMEALASSRELEQVQGIAQRLGDGVERTAIEVRAALSAAKRMSESESAALGESSDTELSALHLPIDEPIDGWRVRALHRALGVASLLYGLAAFALLASLGFRPASVRLPEFWGLGLACAGFALGLRATRLRTLLLLCALGLPNAWIVLERGFMAPTSVLALAVTCLCASLYSSRSVTWFTVLATSGVFVVGSFGSPFGAFDETTVTPLVRANWWRLSFVFPLACLGMSQLVLDLLAGIGASLDGLNRSLDALARARRAREASSGELLLLQTRSEELSPEATPQSVRRDAHDLGNNLAVLLGWSERLVRLSSFDDRAVREATAVFEESAREIAGRLASWDVPSRADSAILVETA